MYPEYRPTFGVHGYGDELDRAGLSDTPWRVPNAGTRIKYLLSTKPRGTARFICALIGHKIYYYRSSDKYVESCHRCGMTYLVLGK